MIIIILLVIFLAADLIAENCFMLCVRREKLGGDIKIVQAADLHKRRFGKNNKRLRKRISAEKPDIILITGDLVSRSCTDLSTAEATLRALTDVAPTYLIFGNHETDFSTEMRDKFIQIVINSGAVLLNNKTAQLRIRGRDISLCGLELPSTVYKKNGKYKNLDTVDASQIHDTLGNKPNGMTILAVHNPLFAQSYAQWGADFAVCGHVHGGVVRIPFTGVGLLSPERRLLPKYSKGNYTMGNMQLLISGGLGKFRLFNPPEIVVYEL